MIKMLKEDKEYNELAIKVATRMARMHMMHEAQTLWEDVIGIAITMGKAIGIENEHIRESLEATFDSRHDDHSNYLADDDEFMTILVDEFGLALSYIDFEAVQTEGKHQWMMLVDDMMEALL